ncbi:MAG TPA: hypothetical protein VHS06_04080 [Chloroflexota bacterium]|nr:hypothetical protein [Chloroflexota bacterium]
MGKNTRVLLYGNSVILASVRATLHHEGTFGTVLVAPPLASAEELEAMAPDVILFDLEKDRPDAVFSLLESRPDIILLGMSPDGNLVRLWSGRQFRELSSKDLENVIEEELAMRSATL